MKVYASVVLMGATGFLGGCVMPYDGNCTRQTEVSTGQLTGDGNYHLVPANGMQFSMYPGQTVVVPVAVQPTGKATGTVVLSALGLPSGVTMKPVTAQIGGTANLTFTSTAALGTECFKAYSEIYTAYSTINLHSEGTTGSKSLGVDLDLVLENPEYKPAATTIPVMNIATTGTVPVDSEDTYVAGSMTITDPKTKSNNYSGTLTIKGHGNTTWVMPKKPYRIKLDSKAKLLGMPSEKNWILLANYDDKTMLRDALASEIANRVGLPWAPRSGFVELTLNGQYEGTYQLIENVDIDKNRVNIADDDASSSDPTQNGYIFEIDQREGNTFHWTTPHGIDASTDDPNPPTVAGAESYVEALVDKAEQSFYNGDAASTTTGWRTYWDENSVIDWFLVEELMGNQDGVAYSSDYFYKDAGNAPLVMGPVWDFDVSSGNDNYDPIRDPAVPWIRTGHPWYAQLFRDPTFQADVKARWTAVRPQIETLPAYLDAQSAALAQSAGNNYQRWPILSERVWPNPEAAGSYQGEVSYLKDWLAKRVAYMDSQYLNQ